MATVAEGDSIAVNGVCLTAVALSAVSFDADLLEATLRDTTLGRLEPGSVLNLEPALRAGDRLGGHLVSGHVDGTTSVLSVRGEQAGTRSIVFELPEWFRPYVIHKGSVCIDGVSLTLQNLEPGSFTVSLIPETLSATSLGQLEAGARVNLEADSIVRTVRHLLELDPGLAQRFAEQPGSTGENL
jgi:riboflavin synthase